MRPRHRVSRAAIELIKRFEGYRAKAAQLPDGRWTIGYGHTVTARAGAEVSEDDAEALLIYDLISVAHVVNESVFAPLTQNQFDALCSFAFNLGADAFRQSQVLKRVNEGQMVQAACAMELWRKAEFQGQRIVIDALVRRRSAEKALFLTPPNGAWVPAPSPVLRPLVDIDARELIPTERPAEVVTSLEGETITVAREDAGAVAAPAPVAPAPEEPGEGLRAAAEQVAARLQTIMSDLGEEPAPTEAEPAPEEAPAEARPQADFAPPITTDIGAEEPELSEHEQVLEELAQLPAAFDVPPPPPANDLEADLRSAVDLAPKVVIHDDGAYEFIPARVAPLPRPKEPSVVLDILLGLLGLAFFSFAIVWGFTARPGFSDGLVTPAWVAWPAGLAGVGFFSLAVYRLLRRVARAAERD
jgi:lysozyme